MASVSIHLQVFDPVASLFVDLVKADLSVSEVAGYSATGQVTRERWRGDFVKELTDEAIDAHIAQAQQLPSALSLMHLYPIDGAVRRVGKSETAWNTRDATWSMVIAGIDSNPQKAGEITRWTKGYWEAVHPYSADGAYVNFMMDDGTTADSRPPMATTMIALSP